MPLYDYNGVTSTEIGKLYDHNGATSSELAFLYDFDGTTQREVFSGTVAVTDIVNWGGWSVVNQPARLDRQPERGPNEGWEGRGLMLYHSSPSVGYGYDTLIRQTFPMANGHIYWLHAWMSGIGDEKATGSFQASGAFSVQWNTPNRDVGFDASVVFTAASTTLQLQSWFWGDGARIRLWQCDLIDVTAAFGYNYTAAQMKNYCDLQCKGRSGTYTINT